jgi:nucleotide-binding universal stress UspA family protein
MFKHILVATDGGALSKKAVKSAIDLAATCNADLTAVTVYAPFEPVFFEGAVLMTTDEIKKIESQWMASSQKIVHAVKAAAAKQNIAAKAIAIKGSSVSDSILKAAKKYNCDAIVMASHGRKGLARILLGNETQQVLTHSTLPVLVLR